MGGLTGGSRPAPAPVVRPAPPPPREAERTPSDRRSPNTSQQRATILTRFGQDDIESGQIARKSILGR